MRRFRSAYLKPALLLLACALLAGGVARWSRDATLETLRQSGIARLDLFARTLLNPVEKYAYLPFILSNQAEVIDALSSPENDSARIERLNGFLETMNRRVKVSAIYVMNAQGIAVAASNWAEHSSLVGKNFSFRPYFTDAIQGRPGKFYGIGTVSMQAGYYLSYPVEYLGKRIGVVVVRVNLDDIVIVPKWSEGLDRLVVTDDNNVIFISSQEDWKNKSLLPLPTTIEDSLARTRQYYASQLKPLPIVRETVLSPGTKLVRFAQPSSWGVAQEYLVQSLPLDSSPWRLWIFTDTHPATIAMLRTAVIALLTEGLVLMFWLYLRQGQRRIRESQAARAALQLAHDNLEGVVKERTADLLASNHMLLREIVVRIRSEETLREAQNELVQAGKMAMLGQMATGISHELNQPLAALRTMSDNAQVLIDRGRVQDARQNLCTISELIERMGKITSQLRSFARKTPGELVPVCVQDAVRHALFLLERRIEDEHIAVVQDWPEEPVWAHADQVRLEQVLINLIRNALDAMKDSPNRMLTVMISQQNGSVTVEVSDTGHGIAPEVQQEIFEPFFTTKLSGEGLGLGLAISADIIRSFGGLMRAGNHAGGGAVFGFDLKACNDVAEPALPTPVQALGDIEKNN